MGYNYYYRKNSVLNCLYLFLMIIENRDFIKQKLNLVKSIRNIFIIMTQNQVILPLYHVDLREHNKDFIEGKYLPEVNKDNKWGGKGLYLWDNVENAKYWQKSHWKGDYEKASIVKTVLTVNEDQILDLTEPNEAKKLENNLKEISKKAANSSNSEIQKYAPLITEIDDKGRAIDLYHDYLAELFGATFSVLKIAGLYPKVRHTKFFFDDFVLEQDKEIIGKYMAPHVTLQSKSIYVVRNQIALKQRILYKED